MSERELIVHLDTEMTVMGDFIGNRIMRVVYRVDGTTVGLITVCRDNDILVIEGERNGLEKNFAWRTVMQWLRKI